MKKFISLLLSLAVSILTCVTVFAAVPVGNDDLVTPCYEMVSRVTGTLSVNGTTATCYSLAYGKSGVTKNKVEQTLEKQDLFWIWGEVDGASWTKTVSSSTATVTNKKTGLDSGTYRLKTVFTLMSSNGTTETITVYSEESNI